MISWAQAQMSWTVIFATAVLTLGMVSFLRKSRLRKNISDKLFPFLTRSVSSTKAKIRLILRFVILLLLSVSLMRPLIEGGKEKVSHQGIEVVFAADVSESMLAEDIKPSRLEFAKADLTKLAEKLVGHKIAVVAFAGKAVLMSPLTSDVSATRMYIDALSPQVVSTQGTSFTEALKVSLGAFERGGIESESQTVSRAIIIVSDGEDHEPGIEKVIDELTNKGIHVYTLAYGTEKGAPIPIRDGMGSVRGYKSDRSGETIITQVVGKELELLAEKGQGVFAFTQGQMGYLDRVIDSINTLKKSSSSEQYRPQYRELFQIPLALALLLLLIEFIFVEKKSNVQIWRGRFEVPKT